jgi:putative nucleotidyltransferase with HDIG domain
MNKNIAELWPELLWIKDKRLREQVAKTWELALEKSSLTINDLNEIPFTLLVPGLKVTFMAHKRCTVHIAKLAGEKTIEFFGTLLPVNLDILIAGAILADVGKLLEYELKDGKLKSSSYGRYLRHPFSGVSLAEQCGVPKEVCHIIAAHAHEGDLVKRSTEAFIVHYADFMTFEPFRSRLEGS